MFHEMFLNKQVKWHLEVNWSALLQEVQDNT